VIGEIERRLRNSPAAARHGWPLILLTSYTSSGTVRHAVRVGAGRPCPQTHSAIRGKPSPESSCAARGSANRWQRVRGELSRKRLANAFDVFLCYNSSDKAAVKQIAQQLQVHGIVPWLDEWELPPGQPWQPLLEQQIAGIKSAAVFVGADGVGPWQERDSIASCANL